MRLNNEITSEKHIFESNYWEGLCNEVIAVRIQPNLINLGMLCPNLSLIDTTRPMVQLYQLDWFIYSNWTGLVHLLQLDQSIYSIRVL